MHPRHYFVASLCGAAILVGGVVAINILVDPFGLSEAPAIASYRGTSEGARPGTFWRKALNLRYVGARTVVLGTSRADFGIDTQYLGFGPDDTPAVNLSMGGLSIDQIRLLLVHANETSPVRKAIIGLDLESFLENGRPDFDPAALKGNTESEPDSLVRLRIDVAREALSASVARWLAPTPAEPEQWANSGPEVRLARAIPDAVLRDVHGQRGVVWVTEFSNFSSHLPLLFPQWPPGTRWNADQKRAASMTAFRRLLDYARNNSIDLRMFISPVHARYLEWYQQVGWWPMFEAWKRALVDTIDQESKSGSGHPAFVLWDFSGFHFPATESVPRIGDMSSRMRWYRETSHYSPEMGNLILDRVLGPRGSDTSPLPDARIDPTTIDRHLAEVRVGAAEYRRSHSDEISNISQMLAYLRHIARK